MINGSLVNTTSFEEYFPDLTWWERGVVFVWLLVMFLVSTIGNAFVLILSKDLKNVTKDSKGSVLLINVAFVDLMFNVFVTLPMLVCSMSRTWVFGSAYCFLDAFFETYLGVLEILFIFLISAHRTLVIRFPFKQQRMITTKKVYIIVGSTYFLGLIPSIIRTVATTQIYGYISEEFHCDNIEVASSGPWKVILQISLIFYAFGPVLLTVLLYVWMMFFAMTKAEPSRTMSSRHQIKGGGGTQMKGPNKALQTVSMIVGIYLVSISLTIIIIVVRIRLPDAIPKRVQLASTCLWLLNTAVNPIIYVYNNPMFRAHLKRLIVRKTGAYATNNSAAASTRRRITEQSMVDNNQGLYSRSGSRAIIQRSSTAVSLMSLTPTPLRKSEIKNMHVVVEEGDREEEVVGNGASLVIENNFAEGNGSLSVNDSSLNSRSESVTWRGSKDESAL
ncbi:trace amine-associated receptor 1-like [Bolinopsis microptera]|uniref:trace amine-associated receptor 1-like n=1 Tax=Bolinopsis microptera TaxID=2820187 RepID=UPI0030799952